MSFGRGGHDAIMAVFLEANGHINAQTKFDSMTEPDDVEEFKAFLEEHKPDVITIGGFTAQTHRLKKEVDGHLKSFASQQLGAGDRMPQGLSNSTEQEYLDMLAAKQIPLIHVQDEVARLYMNSTRALQENPAWPPNARYALGLARYVQDPLNEYCSLGSDITAITYAPKQQALVSQERLLQCLERALVNVVNAVGVEINQAVKDPYLAKCLPFVAGLGPRKAEALIKSITRTGGNLNNRKSLLTDDHLETKICVNAASFIYIAHEQLYETDISDSRDDTEGPDPLDHTRIHPNDYSIAHEIVENVLGIDPEDAQEQNPSKAVVQLWSEENVSRRMKGLMIDAFVDEVKRRTGKSQRLLIGMIVRELVDPYKDIRPPFALPNDWDVLRMLTGETDETVSVGKIVTANVTSVRREGAFVKLDSGMLGEVPVAYISDGAGDARDFVSRHQAVRGVVVAVRPADLNVELTIRQGDVKNAAEQALIDARDRNFNVGAEALDKERQAKQKRTREAGLPRVIDHPAWKHVNKAQAEHMLKDKMRGDVVIRPSSLGFDHIAVTWKVDEGVYQHINVQELDKPSDSELGLKLRIPMSDIDPERGVTYSDLDELIISHINAMVKKLDILTQHEKYRPESQLDGYLINYVQAHPGSSAYGFSLDSKRAGWAKLSFLSRSPKNGGVVQSWPVKILPGAYQLFDAELPGMTELCNAFKMQYKARLEMQKQDPNFAQTPRFTGARTPAGGRTPGMARTPAMGLGARTPMQRAPMIGTPMQRGPVPMGTTPMGAAMPMPSGFGGGGGNPFASGTPFGGASATPFGNNGFGSQGPFPMPPQMPPQNMYNAPPPPSTGFPRPPPPSNGMNPERA